MNDNWLNHLLTTPVYNIKNVDKIIDEKASLLVLVKSDELISEGETKFIDSILSAANVNNEDVQRMPIINLPNGLIEANTNSLKKVMCFGFEVAPKIKYQKVGNLHFFSVGAITDIIAMNKEAKKKVWSQVKRFLLMEE